MISTASRGRLVAAPDLEPSTLPDETIRRKVWTLLAGLYPHNAPVERRGVQRFAYPQLLRLTTVEADGLTPGNTTLIVVGKTLSERGLGFFHREPLPYRRMIASLEDYNREWIGFLLDITWCRFTPLGWYESGGRFLQALPGLERGT